MTLDIARGDTPMTALEIVKGLSEAQRASIMDAMPTMLGDTFWYRRNRVIATLHRKGLADYHQAPARLTQLAVQVRTLLKDNNNGNG